jgi:hypothetical protein
MKRHISKRFFLFTCFVLATVMVLTIFQTTGFTQFNIPQLPGGIKIPSLPGGKTGFGGLDALNTAKELFGQKDKASYPTPNIGVSGNHIVIAWPNGVVTVETIADDGTLHRAVLGPPSESNVGGTGEK